jgi:hypothetical protein
LTSAKNFLFLPESFAATVILEKTIRAVTKTNMNCGDVISETVLSKDKKLLTPASADSRPHSKLAPRRAFCMRAAKRHANEAIEKARPTRVLYTHEKGQFKRGKKRGYPISLVRVASDASVVTVSENPDEQNKNSPSGDKVWGFLHEVRNMP